MGLQVTYQELPHRQLEHEFLLEANFVDRLICPAGHAKSPNLEGSEQTLRQLVLLSFIRREITCQVGRQLLPDPSLGLFVSGYVSEALDVVSVVVTLFL